VDFDDASQNYQPLFVETAPELFAYENLMGRIGEAAIASAFAAYGITKTLGGVLGRVGLFFFANPIGLALLAAGTLAYFASIMTEEILKSPEWKKYMEGKGFNPDGTPKTDEQQRREAAAEIAAKNKPEVRQMRYNSAEEFFKNNGMGDDGKRITVSDVGGRMIPPGTQDIVLSLKKPLKDGTKFINITKGEKYLDTSIEKGVFKSVATPGAAPAAAPEAPQGASPGAAPAAAPAAPMGAPAPAAAPAGAPAAPATPPNIKGSVSYASPEDVAGMTPPAPAASAPPSWAGKLTAPSAPPAKPTISMTQFGAAKVLTNTIVTNTGSASGGETNNMAGQNLPMFTRNPNLQQFFGRQLLPSHQ
jgi:hypothetical protein